MFYRDLRSTIPGGTFRARKPIFGGWTRDENDKARDVQAEILPPDYSRGVPARIDQPPPAPQPAAELDRDEIPVGTFRATKQKSGTPPGGGSS